MTEVLLDLEYKTKDDFDKLFEEKYNNLVDKLKEAIETTNIKCIVSIYSFIRSQIQMQDNYYFGNKIKTKC